MPQFDYGHQLADESLERLEKKYARIYAQAAREMTEKQRKALEGFERENSQRLKALDQTDRQAVKRYKAWLSKQATDNAWLASMVDELSRKATQANELAIAALNDTLPGIYAENANYAAYTIDRAVRRDTAFTLVDEDTVRNLMMNQSMEAVGSVYTRTDRATAAGGRLLPEITFPKVDRPRDYRWNRQRFTSAITQGVLQGESIPNIVKRTRGIFGSNMAAAVRAARTATTSAENAGRISSYERAEGIGISMRQQWVATLDMRTRESHRKLDGEKVEVGEAFQTDLGPIRFPGDPLAEPELCYNCRCTLIAAVEGFDMEKAKRYAAFPKGMGYEDWKAAKDAAFR